MQFKHKLIYFALGCAFVVIAQVLLSIVVPKVTAQGKKEAVEFDKVKVRSLEVMDDTGKVRAVLEVIKRPSATPMDDVIQVFNSVGIPVYRVGVDTDGGNVTVWGKNGNPGAGMSVDTNGNGSIVTFDNKMKLNVMIGTDNGGVVQVNDSEGKKYAVMGALIDGGAVSVYNDDGNPCAAMRAYANGGVVVVLGNDNKVHAAIGVDDYGHGVVNTWDKNGRKTR